MNICCPDCHARYAPESEPAFTEDVHLECPRCGYRFIPTLAARTAARASVTRRMVWVDRTGLELPALDDDSGVFARSA